jgi:N-acetyl sugar amidotransferase
MSKIIKVTDDILDKQLGLLPKDVKFCKTCVVSNQRPRIEWDQKTKGQCSACDYGYEKDNIIDWDEREKQLQKVCDKHRSKDGSYDVIIPGSGGKDSGMVTHKLKYKYGMHPLTVTWAPFLYTDIGWKNFTALKDKGFDNILVHPNGQLHRKLSLLAFDLHGDAWDPFGLGQQSLAYHMSVKYNVPLILMGENGEVEYGGSLATKDLYEPPRENWSDEFYKGSSLDNLLQAGLKRNIFTKDEIRSSSFDMYSPPSEEDLKRVGTEMHWMSYYQRWTPQWNYYYAVENCGFEANDDRSEGTYQKYGSIDDKLDGFHWWMAYMKFGICRTTYDAAHEIRDGHINREEAVALVHKYDGEFPAKYWKDFLDYLDITDKEFWYVADKYRSERIWTPSGAKFSGYSPEAQYKLWKLNYLVE